MGEMAEYYQDLDMMRAEIDAEENSEALALLQQWILRYSRTVLRKKKLRGSARENLKPSRLLWATQNGREVQVGKMQDSHLSNALLYVERNCPLIHEHAVDALELDTVVDALDGHLSGQARNETFMARVVSDIQNMRPEEYLFHMHYYVALYNEARRRRLGCVPVTSWFSWGYDVRIEPLEGRVVSDNLAAKTQFKAYRSALKRR